MRCLTVVVMLSSVQILMMMVTNAVAILTIGFDQELIYVSEGGMRATATVSVQSGDIIDHHPVHVMAYAGYQRFQNTASQNVDYVPFSMRLEFDQNHTNLSVSIDVIDDDLFEELLEEVGIRVELITESSDITIARDTVIILIEDNDGLEIGFDPMDYTVFENQTRVPLTVRLFSGNVDTYVDLRVIVGNGTTDTAVNGEDFQQLESYQVIGFSPSDDEDVLTIIINVVNDLDFERVENVTVELTPIIYSNGNPNITLQPSTVVITIIDDDAPGILVLPIYSVDGTLKAVDISLYDIEPVALETIDNFVLSYTHSSGETCTNVIPIANCSFSLVCRDDNIRSCPFSAVPRMSGTLTLTIVAVREIGQNHPTIPTTFSSFNQLCIPRVDLAARKINCQLNDVRPSVYGHIHFVTHPGCVHMPFFSSGTMISGSTTSVELLLPDELPRGFTYCYSITVNTSTSSVTVEGRFQFDCDPLDLGTMLNTNTECEEDGFSSFGITGGSVCYDGASVDSVATYSCIDNCGYGSLQGSDTRRCLADGMWSGQLPLCECRPDLPPPPSIKCGDVIQTDCIIATYTVNSDAYDHFGSDSTITFDCATGKWPEPPKCRALTELSTGAIVGIAVGIVLFVLFISITCVAMVIIITMKTVNQITVSTAQDVEMKSVPKGSELDVDDKPNQSF